MKIHFYGSRGSIPSPLLLKNYRLKIKKILELYNQNREKGIDEFMKIIPFDLSHIYGGNTACTVIRDDEMPKDNHLIIDAGSGLRIFGNEFIGKNGSTFHIILSHFHWDHICGLPFFKPIYNPKNKVYFYSPFKDTLKNLRRQQHKAHFPMTFDNLPAEKEIIKLKENKVFNLLGFEIRPILLKHPGKCYAFILEGYNKKISYISDGEFTHDSIIDKEAFYKECFENSDAAIMDSQYHLIEFFNKFDWGHTSTNMVINLALDWQIKKLIMFHFDPDHSDEELIKILKEAKEQKDFLKKPPLEVFQAIEGTYIEV
ncbi:MAG: MBL fold metallo-hydrolase [Spirochaetes bacterium]|nr:MBL fold metallo-hydrolase [Spirochaetota bacterium]